MVNVTGTFVGDPAVMVGIDPIVVLTFGAVVVAAGCTGDDGLATGEVKPFVAVWPGAGDTDPVNDGVVPTIDGLGVTGIAKVLLVFGAKPLGFVFVQATV